MDAGVRWKDLVIAAAARGLTPPVLTGYTNLSIGGTLSVGGVSGRNYAGAQVDHVQELEVVTGEGHLRRCSRHEHRDLFDAVLAGLGQCGVITRVKMDLVRARQMARIYNPVYFDTATFFRDLRTLINRGELNEIYNIWVPGPSPTGFLRRDAARGLLRSVRSARRCAAAARVERAARSRPASRLRPTLTGC